MWFCAKQAVLAILIFVFVLGVIQGQTPDTMETTFSDSLSIKDTLAVNDSLLSMDSIAIDSLKGARPDSLGVAVSDRVEKKSAKPAYLVSPDSLDSEVKYSADDSILFHVQKQQIHLFGNAQVDYTSTQLMADY